MKESDQFLPQVRFNWGFHDATSDGKDGRPARDMASHPDPFYAAGYTNGWRVWEGLRQRPHSSEPTWLEYVTTTPGAREATRYAESKAATQSYIDDETEKKVRELLRTKP